MSACWGEESQGHGAPTDAVNTEEKDSISSCVVGRAGLDGWYLPFDKSGMDDKGIIINISSKSCNLEDLVKKVFSQHFCHLKKLLIKKNRLCLAETVLGKEKLFLISDPIV